MNGQTALPQGMRVPQFASSRLPAMAASGLRSAPRRSEVNRRRFLRAVAGGAGLLALHPAAAIPPPAVKRAAGPTDADAKLRELIDAHRPSRLPRLPPRFNDRVGAAHVDGKYCLSEKPFLLEGAEKLLALGTRLGKFWFMPDGVAKDYPFHSDWGRYTSPLELARSEYFQKLFARPFSTFILEAPLPANNLTQITQDFYELAVYLYEVFRDRRVTIIIQHWEGDWLLRGRGGETWSPPSADWRQRCQRMTEQLAARQAGIASARTAHGQGAQCRVAHAAEVNRVTDLWKGIPTMTEHVLPNVELDLVSYSSYDGLKDGVTLWKCIAEIKKHARTTGLFGPNPVYVGEIGLPENEQPRGVAERWDEWFGALLAADVPYVAMWELYCNEFNPKRNPRPQTPVKDPNDVRGFWLVRPDGSLSQTGKFFHDLWQRAATEK